MPKLLNAPSRVARALVDTGMVYDIVYSSKSSTPYEWTSCGHVKRSMWCRCSHKTSRRMAWLSCGFYKDGILNLINISQPSRSHLIWTLRYARLQHLKSQNSHSTFRSFECLYRWCDLRWPLFLNEAPQSCSMQMNGRSSSSLWFFMWLARVFSSLKGCLQIVQMKLWVWVLEWMMYSPALAQTFKQTRHIVSKLSNRMLCTLSKCTSR